MKKLLFLIIVIAAGYAAYVHIPQHAAKIQSQIEQNLSETFRQKDVPTSVVTNVSGRNVSLSGLVENQQVKDNAADVARAVEGVRIVENNIEVFEPATIPRAPAVSSDNERNNESVDGFDLTVTPQEEIVMEEEGTEEEFASDSSISSEPSEFMPPMAEEAVSPDLEPPPPPELEEEVGELEIEAPPSDSVLENIEDQYPEAMEGDQPAQKTDSQKAETVKMAAESSCDEKVASILAKNKITFERGSTRIQSGSHSVLNDIAREIKKCPDVVIYIHGHTDNTGDYQSNRLISLNRAKSVGRYIISKGALQEIRVVGHGPDQPVATNDTAEGRAANRRIEFKFTPIKTSE